MSKLLLITLLCLIYSGQSVAIGPCDFELQYRVSQARNGSFQISLETKGNSVFLRIKLHDLYSGLTVEEKQVQLNENDERIAFETVKPSLYVIYFSSASCPRQRTLGGIEGIKVGD